MPEPLTRFYAYVLYRLAKRDVVSADRAAASGDGDRSAQLVARADARLKRACGLNGWPCHRRATSPASHSST